MMDNSVKEAIKKQIIEAFRQDKEIEKVVLFGSFLSSDEPNDIDLAIFQNSNENYLSLALKYRKQLRAIAVQIPIDLIPIVSGRSNDFLMNEINCGLVLYER
ncbi:MAG: nucleotidyltransferase domain-containing protein [Ignavibacteriales bacterium]|nr:nucleotidyltransferase domain-containing protein [Ignavibacteriales bacterium]